MKNNARIRNCSCFPKKFGQTKIPSKRKPEGTRNTVWSAYAETKTPHDNKTDYTVSFFIRCLGSLIRTNAWYSQPCGWRATQCCSAYALQRSLFSCVGIIARLFAFCNRVSEQIFVSGVSCRYLPTSQLYVAIIFAGNRLRTETQNLTRNGSNHAFSPRDLPFMHIILQNQKAPKAFVNMAFSGFRAPVSAPLPTRELSQERLKST